jgi:hypothetical protein
MIFQNQELAQQIFVSNDHCCYATWPQLKDEPVNRDIYFSATNSPRTNRLDYRKGSCFKNWYLPSTSILVHGTNGQIDQFSELTQTLGIKEYKTRVDQYIRNCITTAFQENNIVNLAYSGSMDSTIVLAYIVNMGLMNRTRTVCFKSLITNMKDALRFDSNRIVGIDKFFYDNQNKLAGHAWETIEVDDLVKIINAEVTFTQLIPFTLASVLTRSQNQAWIGGWHGNRTMLHHRMLLDQMRLLDPSVTPVIKKRIDACWETSYSHTIRKIDLDVDPVHVKYQTHRTKSWHALNGYRGHKIYMPCGLEEMFKDLRCLNPLEFVFELVADGSFGMELIQDNAPELLQWMTAQQSENDIDGLEYILVPTKNLDYSKLLVPTDINHNNEGLDWINHEIKKSQETGQLEFNTILSIKNLQWISDQVHGR